MGKPRVMLVEDEEITAQDIRTSLEELGYEVPAVTASGDDAVRLAAEVRPDLILMDIVLDGPMSGIEAAALIRKAQPTPVVFLTAHTDTKTLDEAKATEPFGYLPKPCALSTMRSTIEVALFKGEAETQRRKAAAERMQLIEELCRAQTELEAALQEVKQHKKTLEDEVCRRTAQLTNTVTTLQWEVEAHARTMEALRSKEAELLHSADELRQANSALHALLQRRDREREELVATVLTNINKQIAPTLDKLCRSGLTEKQQHLLQIAEVTLKEVFSPICEVPAEAPLTRTERQIYNLVLQRKTSKEIGDILDISTRTVDTHRNNIRKKFGIQGKHQSLRTHLITSRNT